MRNCATSVWIVIAMIALGSNTAVSGEKGSTVVHAESPWLASLSAGWDSLYMFRGVNQLPGYENYGSSISWSALSISFSPTATDSISLSSWSAFGLGESDYKEVDGSVAYTKSIGSLSLFGGYSLYAVLSAPEGLYAHELSTAVAYEIALGIGNITPALEYAYTVGPTVAHGGYVKAGSSYVELRIDGDIPIFGGIFRAAPWIASGLNFGYNTKETMDGAEPFNGVNHVEAGFSLPVRVHEGVSIVPYFALSYELASFVGTPSNVVWGGAALIVEF